MRLQGGIKIYRKLRCRKGHGVHSPFVYSLITKVIEEKHPYYVFERIESLRKQLQHNGNGFGSMLKAGSQSKRYGELLFRLVLFFRCKQVLQVGASLGMTTCYLAAADSGCRCFVIAQDADSLQLTQQLTAQLNLENVRIVAGDYFSELDRLRGNAAAFDLIFVNVADPELCNTILELCSNSTMKDRVIVIDGINRTRPMRECWKQIKKDPKVKISIDLYWLGLVIFREKIEKQHYNVYFNNGEK
ncbi:MAG: hypothetical protein LBR67_05980 [Dysgonamonadaceae bacterium]|nr:hypothetical protein [Dysgonamonadaceae bacterium]